MKERSLTTLLIISLIIIIGLSYYIFNSRSKVVPIDLFKPDTVITTTLVPADTQAIKLQVVREISGKHQIEMSTLKLKAIRMKKLYKELQSAYKTIKKQTKDSIIIEPINLKEQSITYYLTVFEDNAKNTTTEVITYAFLEVDSVDVNVIISSTYKDSISITGFNRGYDDGIRNTWIVGSITLVIGMLLGLIL